MKSWLIRLPAGLLALVLIVWSVVNRQPVDIDLAPMPYILTVPAFFLLMAGLIAGVLMAILVRLPTALRQRRRLKQAERRANALSRQLAERQSDGGSDPQQTGRIEAAQEAEAGRTGRTLAKSGP